MSIPPKKAYQILEVNMEKRSFLTDHGRIGRETYKRWFYSYLFIMPALIGAFFFGFFPLFRSIGMAFTKWNGMTDAEFIGFNNFTRLFNDQKFFFELRNTFIFAFASVPFSMLLSILLANALNANRGPVGLMRVIYYLPAVTMPVAIASVWRWMLNEKSGLVNSMLDFLNIKGPPWINSPDWVLISLIIVTVWGGLGYNMIVLLASLKNIPRTYYEAAKIDGANKFQEYLHITQPLLTPTVFFLLITSVIGAFKAFDIVYMFNGVSSEVPVGLVDASRTMVYGIFVNGFKFMELGYATAEAAILLLIILVITGIQFLAEKYWVNYDI